MQQIVARHQLPGAMAKHHIIGTTEWTSKIDVGLTPVNNKIEYAWQSAKNM